jgi:twitching motility protein PilT
MTEDQRAVLERDLELDFLIAFGEKARFRINAFHNRQGTSAVFRTIPSSIPTLEQLDLPDVMRRFSELEKGIVLVTGATGSGKSTTLAAMINHINEDMNKHVLTIEDPVEFFHVSKKSLINHREVGTDTRSFARALKSALREDPDVILVGEMRDHETISLALTAAETGHLVFGTLHASSAPGAVNRILDVFPLGDREMARTMLSGSLEGVISQRLLKRADGSGRVGCYEIMVGTSAVRNLIRENQIPQIYSMIQTGSRYGMITMEDAIDDLVESKIITTEEARLAKMKGSDESLATPAKGGTPAPAGRPGAAPGVANAARPAAADAPAPAKAKESGSDEGYSF